MSEAELFAAALEKPAEERRAFLAGACGGDEKLRRRVEALLNAHDEPSELLERVVNVRPTEAYRPVSEAPGAVIGPYKLLQKIGEGGFGVVFMAEQRTPVHRKVALKIIKPGMDTAQVIARFESERQALALMDHPHIAKVLDAGATESGRPYFVMELVNGVPITEFCDKNHLPAEARLKLFVDVCHAIQHAHHKGVIHRDVKPSNVLVTLHDGVPVVKVIDFGVAKATVQKLTEKTLFTAFGQMIGTPTYMSPEQAEMSGLDIDTRSDVYSLGVLLYELLTGTTPLEAKRLREAGYAEVQRLIREEEPPRPSTRLSSLGDSATVFAGNRGTDVKHLSRLLAGDLDCIVMKALEKDRNRRYDTPGGFAEDIHRYLRHDAILARRPSTAYKLRKFVRRNRGVVSTGMVVVAAMALGTTLAVWQAMVAQRERRNAEAGFLQARRAVDQYFTTVSENKLLDVPGLQPLRKELLDQALKYYQDFLAQRAGDRTVAAETAAASYRVAVLTMQIGADADTRAAFRRAHEMYEELVREHPQEVKYRCDLAIVCNDYGRFFQAVGELDDALRLHRQAQAMREKLVAEHPENARMQNELAKSLHNVGVVHSAKRQYADALTLVEQGQAINVRLVQSNPKSLEFPGDLGQRYSTLWHIRLDLAVGLERIGYIQLQCRRRAAALEAYRQSLALYEALFLERPADIDVAKRIADVCGDLGWCLDSGGDRREARTVYERGLAVAEQLIAANPTMTSLRPTLAGLHNNLGRLEHNSGQLVKAIEHFDKARGLLEKIVREQASIHGPRYQLAWNWRATADVQKDLGRSEECFQSYRNALIVLQPLVKNFPRLPTYRTFLRRTHELFAAALHDSGRNDEALAQYRSAIEAGQQAIVEFPDNLTFLNDLSWFLANCPEARARDPQRAVVLARKAVEAAPTNGSYANTLGVAHYRADDFSAAIAALNKSISLGGEGHGDDFFFLAMAHWRLGEKDKAREWFAKAVAWMDKQGKDDLEMKRFRAEATALLGVATKETATKSPAPSGQAKAPVADK